MDAPDGAWPRRLVRARESRAELAGRGVFFAPVRHHSPACALAVRALIEEVGPAAVLIEGPADYDRLLPALADAATRPPVAVLSLRTSDGERVSSFYPLADFSPEWVGLRLAADRGVPTAFIDLPWAERESGDAGVRALQGERYYAESRTLAALARQEHCRDHDELWDHLFESRDPDGGAVWPRLFDDVFAWSALARLDYEPEVLAAEGSLAREAAMAGHVARWRDRVGGPIVVITGAFHTLALVERLASGDVGEPGGGAGEAWLVPYDLARLDALAGYGAGIRSPGYRQRFWDACGNGTQRFGDARRPGPGTASDATALSAGTSASSLATALVVDVARLANDQGTADRVSLAEAIEAALQAERLAGLRGHRWPGRDDLLDACSSCFGHGDLAPAVRDAIAEVFGGSRVGQVPPGTPVPPIVAEARATAERLRFDVSDSARRHTVLDVRRSAAARRRSRFLALMDFVGAGFASQTAGPDFVTGHGLGRLREEWDYAWTPMVEARLVAQAGEGATLAEVARRRLHAAEAAAPERSSGAAAQLVAQAAVIGLDDEVDRLASKLDRLVEQDPGLDSVLAAVRRLLGLWRSRQALALAAPERLTGLVERALPQLAYLMGQVAGVAEDAEEAAVEGLIGAHELVREPEVDAGVVVEALRRSRAEATAPGVLGAALGLGAADGEVGEADLADRVRARFAPGAAAELAVRFLGGLMRAAPDLLLHALELFEAVDDAVAGLDEDDFLAFLPDLRRSFSRLKPLETARLAELAAAGAGLGAETLLGRIEATERDLGLAAEVERALRQSLAHDGLADWADVGAGGVPSPTSAAMSRGLRGRAEGPMAERCRRWRLILGRYAEDSLGGPGGPGGPPGGLSGTDGDLDRVLGFLYDREYADRGHRLNDRAGGLGPSRLTALTWLERARALFPTSTFERLQTEAVTRYGVTDLLADPKAAAALPPSPELGAALLSLRGRLDKKLEEGLRTVIAKVVEDIVARLKASFTAAFMGRRDRFRPSVQPLAANFDPRATIRANLAHYDTESARLLIDRARFVSRAKRRLTWDVVLCVDQSASMADSVLHSAVVASILAGLPGVNVRLLLFDTSVVDLSHLAHDPVGVLMTAQLGGGTDIAAALAHAETLVATPKRTVLALISDFEEGGSVPALLASVSRLREAGVTLLGVAALGDDAEPVFDRHVGGLLADRGMPVAALTPDRLAEWLAEVMR
jgi:hypothetical protein